MAKIEPEEQDFDPDEFDEAARERAFALGIELFDSGRYHDAHEAFEQCWLGSEGGGADFYKGLIQASICLYHLERGNLDGARPLFAGHRRLLGAFLPSHEGVDVAGFLARMQSFVQPALRPGAEPLRFEDATRPRVQPAE